jgi:hypothetical protein
VQLLLRSSRGPLHLVFDKVQQAEASIRALGVGGGAGQALRADLTLFVTDVRDSIGHVRDLLQQLDRALLSQVDRFVEQRRAKVDNKIAQLEASGRRPSARKLTRLLGTVTLLKDIESTRHRVQSDMRSRRT